MDATRHVVARVGHSIVWRRGLGLYRSICSAVWVRGVQYTVPFRGAKNCERPPRTRTQPVPAKKAPKTALRVRGGRREGGAR